MASNSSSKLFVWSIIFVGIVGGYLVYSAWIKPGEEVIPPPAISNKDNLSAFQNLSIDFSVIASATEELKISGESPVQPGVTGKKDLFAQ
jgi:uncharacterized membrane protein YagU involved in acid resistance